MKKKKNVRRSQNFEKRGVAQSGSAPALGAGSRRFKSSRPDHFFMSSSGLLNPLLLVLNSLAFPWPFFPTQAISK
jgi:hypothetical protein